VGRRHPGPVRAPARQVDRRGGDGLAVRDGPVVRIVDVQRRALLPHELPFVAEVGFDVAFAADAPVLVVAGGTEVRAWDPRTGRPASGAPACTAAGAVVSVALTPDGRRAALSLDRKGVEIVDLREGRRTAVVTRDDLERGMPRHPLVWAPDGQLLAAGSDSGQVEVWDASTRSVADSGLAIAGGRVSGLVFSRDGRSLVAAGSGSVAAWDLEAGVITHSLIEVDDADAEVAVGARADGSLSSLTIGTGVRRWLDRRRRSAARAGMRAGRADPHPAGVAGGAARPPVRRVCSTTTAD
jgi:WD40 repeat protein